MAQLGHLLVRPGGQGPGLQRGEGGGGPLGDLGVDRTVARAQGSSRFERDQHGGDGRRNDGDHDENDYGD